ncbi:MAG: hypothetical protein KAS32_04520 [Candidatus Peribacteraceae bacterium]|nr:hypothetical protein [Candidatus Peribacteraceae bacterium]
MGKKRSWPHQGSLTPEPPCHNGSLHLFTWKDGIQFWGGGSSRNMSLEGIDLVIDCADVAEPKIQLFGVDPVLFPFIGAPSRILIDWPDMKVPDLEKSDWEIIVKGIEKLYKSRKGKELNILACCIGGHGRTGTTLSILAAMTVLKGKKKQCPVTFIRDNYCDEAVESESQKDYIEDITGHKVNAKISKYVFATTGYASRFLDEFDDDDDDEITGTHGQSKVAAWRRGDFRD